MATGPFSLILRQFRVAAVVRRSDAELLAQFIEHREEEAFAEVVRRHGPMVMGVCRRVLGDVHDAEDACQATFLVLTRKASQVRNQASLGSWLYEVAVNVARRAKVLAARRRMRERQAGAMARSDATEPPEAVEAWRELVPVLDEVLSRLPEKYRRPVVLCYLQGKTHAQAASELGCPAGSISWRLQQALRLLHRRLTGRGVTLSVGLLGILLTERGAAGGPLPPAFVAGMGREAVRFAAGQAVGEAATLAGHVLRSFTTAQVRLGVILLLTAGVLGGGVWAHQVLTPVPTAPTLPQTTSAPPPRDRGDEPLPKGAVGRLGTRHGRHGDAVQTVVFAPDGSHFASSGVDGTVRLWSKATGAEVRRFAGAHSQVGALALTPDGRYLAAEGAAHNVILWEVATGKVVRRLAGHTGGLAALAWSADGKRLASASLDATVRCWETATGNELWQARGWTSAMQQVGFTADQALMVAVGERGHARIWEADTGKEQGRFVIGVRVKNGVRLKNPSLVTAAALSPDGTRLATGLIATGLPGATGRDCPVRIWDTATGHIVASCQGHEGFVTAIRFSRDGRQLLSADCDRVLCLWEADTGRLVQRIEEAVPPVTAREFANLRGATGPLPPLTALDFTPSGDRVVTGGADGVLRHWSLADRRLTACAKGLQQGPVWAVTCSLDGQTVVAACGDAVRVWDRRTGTRRWLEGSVGPVTALALGADGTTLTTWGGDRQARTWDLPTGRLRATRPDPDGAAVPLAARQVDQELLSERPDFPPIIAPNGKVFAAREAVAPNDGSPPRRVRVTTKKGEEPKLTVEDLRQHLVRVWDDKGTTLHRFPLKDKEQIACLALAPDGKTLAAGGADPTGKRTVWAWNLTTGQFVRDFPAPPGPVKTLAFSPDGKRLAIGGTTADPTVYLYEVASARLLARFRGHQGAITALAFASGDKTLVSGSRDTTVLVWDLTKPLPGTHEKD